MSTIIVTLLGLFCTAFPISTVAARPTPTLINVAIVGIQEGEVVTGSVVVEASVIGDGVSQVEFTVSGPTQSQTTLTQAPYILGSVTNGTPDGWDTTQLADGDYTLTATAFDATGASVSTSVQFSVANNVQTAPHASAPEAAETTQDIVPEVVPEATAETPTDGMTQAMPEATTETPGDGATQAAPDTTIALAIPSTCTGTQVRPGSSIQSAIDRASTGARICIQAGRYRLTSTLRPKQGQTLQGLPGAVLSGAALITRWQRSGDDWVAYNMLPTRNPTLRGTCMPNYSGCRYPHDVFFDNAPLTRVMSRSSVKAGTFYADYSNNAIYIGSNPSGHTVEVARTTAAISAQHSRTIIRGLTVEKFASVYQDGAIFVGGSDSLVELNESRYNHGVGIKMYGTRITVRKNYAHHNGHIGITGTRLIDGVVADNELAYNNYARFYNFDGEVGGGKWTYSEVTVRNNYVHHNKGIGLWFDVDCKDVLIEGNRSSYNDSDGIRAEISYNVVIRSNTVSGNAFVIGRQKNNTSIWMGGGIVVNTVTNVEITGNTVDNNMNGMEIRKGDRGSGRYGYRDLRNANIHHNTVRLQQGATGLVQHDDPAVYTSKNNRFRDNTYYLASSSQFTWRGDSMGRRRWQEYGNDVNGKFYTLPRTNAADTSLITPAEADQTTETYQTFIPLVVNR